MGFAFVGLGAVGAFGLCAAVFGGCASVGWDGGGTGLRSAVLLTVGAVGACLADVLVGLLAGVVVLVLVGVVVLPIDVVVAGRVDVVVGTVCVVVGAVVVVIGSWLGFSLG